jgi:hypothetical protein
MALTYQYWNTRNRKRDKVMRKQAGIKEKGESVDVRGRQEG